MVGSFQTKNRREANVADLGFKFLPVLGEYVVDVLEGKSKEYTRLWQWRRPTEEQAARIRDNATADRLNWHKQRLATPEDLNW